MFNSPTPGSGLNEPFGEIIPSASVNAVKKIVYTATGSVGGQSDEIYFSCSLPSLAAGFIPGTITQDQPSTLAFTVSQVNGNPLYYAGFTDNLLAGLKVAKNPKITNNCGNGSSLLANPDASSFTFSGFSLSFNNTLGPACSFSVDVTNQPDLTNTSCASAPVAFTHDAGSLPTDAFNLFNLVPACLVVNYQQRAFSSFSPGGAGRTRPVIITGLHLNGATSVTFGGVAAKSFIVNSDTQITAIVDPGATGIIKVTTPGGTADSLTTFTFLANSIFLPVTVR